MCFSPVSFHPIHSLSYIHFVSPFASCFPCVYSYIYNKWMYLYMHDSHTCTGTHSLIYLTYMYERVEIEKERRWRWRTTNGNTKKQQQQQQQPTRGSDSVSNSRFRSLLSMYKSHILAEFNWTKEWLKCKASECLTAHRYVAQRHGCFKHIPCVSQLQLDFVISVSGISKTLAAMFCCAFYTLVEWGREIECRLRIKSASKLPE